MFPFESRFFVSLSDALLMHWQFPHDTHWPRPPICSVTWFSSAHPKNKKKGEEEKAAGRFSDTVFGIHSSFGSAARPQYRLPCNLADDFILLDVVQQAEAILLTAPKQLIPCEVMETETAPAHSGVPNVARSKDSNFTTYDPVRRTIWSVFIPPDTSEGSRRAWRRAQMPERGGRSRKFLARTLRLIIDAPRIQRNDCGTNFTFFVKRLWFEGSGFRSSVDFRGPDNLRRPQELSQTQHFVLSSVVPFKCRSAVSVPLGSDIRHVATLDVILCGFSSNMKATLLLHLGHLQGETHFSTNTSVWTAGGILSNQNSALRPFVYSGSGWRQIAKDYARFHFVIPM
ncbi:hypothetical protein EYF80_015355 [Liparis tanakae]|uniref:Uncharacterized protein n=1 Tax=Liparis tanakae TaxID=230148 RepID=A0A4Z2I8P8_9TELE|nr:hypothetical protein EYF80_015355 [Liparis tanakae]